MWYLNLYFVCETDKVRNFYMVIKSGTDFYVWSELWMAEDVRSGDVRSNMSEVTRNMKSELWLVKTPVSGRGSGVSIRGCM